MTLLQKLTDLMRAHGDTVASLSRRSGVPYTTIDGLFKKGFVGARISTVESIARCYGVSLDYLIRDDVEDPGFGLPSETLTGDERRLLRSWRAATDQARQFALQLLESNPQEQVERNA